MKSKIKVNKKNQVTQGNHRVQVLRRFGVKYLPASAIEKEKQQK